MFRAHLRRKCSLLFLDGMSYIYQLNLSDLLCLLKLLFPYLFSFGWVFKLGDIMAGLKAERNAVVEGE